MTNKERREERKRRSLESRLPRREAIVKIGKFLALGGLIGTGIYGATKFFQEGKKDGKNEEKAKPSKFVSKYGKVVYQSNPESPNRLYIIGQIHHAGALDKYIDEELKKLVKQFETQKKDNISRVQLDVYRILQHLIEKEGISLVLPEGLNFDKDTEDIVNKHITERREKWKHLLLEKQNDEVLEDLIKKDLRLIEAWSLAGITYDILIRGYENKDLLESHKESFAGIIKLSKEEEKLTKLLENYIKELRSMCLLLHSSATIEEEYKLGNIKNKKGIAIIGNAHLDEIIEFVRNGRITVNPVSELNLEGVNVDFNLKEFGYGVTIIRPNSLLK